MAKGTLSIRVVGDTKQFDKSMSNLTSNVANVGKKIAVASAAVAAAGGAIGVKVLQMGAAFQDLERKAATVFEDQLGSAKKWSASMAGAMGLTSRELLGMTAGFADLLKPMGFTAEQATKLSMETNELSGALAKWSGGQKTAAEVSEILAKAMLGERDGLKALGISISEADVQARLAVNGTKELTGAALEQAKAIATSQLITEKSTDAQKAWADGQDDLSVKINTLKAGVLEFRDNAVATLLPHVVAITEKFIEWGRAVAEKVKPILEDLKAWWDANGPVVIERVTAVANAVKVVAVGAFEALRNMFGFVIDHIEVFLPLAASVLSAVLAWKVWVGIQTAITIATGAWTAAQALLNVVMAANPIGIVVLAIAGLVAGLVTAYQTSETFRKVWDTVWAAVTKGGAIAANAVIGILEGMLQAFRNYFQYIRNSIQALRNVANAVGISLPDIPNLPNVSLPRVSVPGSSSSAAPVGADDVNARARESRAVTVNVYGESQPMDEDRLVTVLRRAELVAG